MFPYKFIWKVNIPLKIKVCFWLALQNSVLTKDNLTKRGWNGGKACVFCGINELVEYLFLHCSIAFIWSIMQCTFNLGSIPSDLKNMFTTCLSQFGKDKKDNVDYWYFSYSLVYLELHK